MSQIGGDEVSAAEYARKAKDLNGKIRTFASSYSTAAAGVLFFILAGGWDIHLAEVEEIVLAGSLMMFFLTVLLYLWGLEVERQRFSFLSRDIQAEGKCWNCPHEIMFQDRVAMLEKLMYLGVFFGTIGSMVFVILRVT